MNADDKTMPFLSVITRHLIGRERLLAVNQASLRAQSDPDYEQIVVVDEIGRGWEYAHQMHIEGARMAAGEYILTLDDDDMVIQSEAIAIWKEAAKSGAEVILHKTLYDVGILPDEAHWKWRPEMGFIGTCCFLLRKDVHAEYLPRIGPGRYASDFDLINAVWKDYGDGAVRVERVMCAALKRSQGAR